MNDTSIRIGGMLRCCIKMLGDIPDDAIVNSGEIKKCPYCAGSAILRGPDEAGKWYWEASFTKTSFPLDPSPDSRIKWLHFMRAMRQERQ
jgi:hypothetical protein